MGDSISFKLIAGDLKKEMADIDRRVDRATMWGLRDTGRVIARAARKNAPKYRGDDKRAEPGLLKKSIKGSRQLKRLGRGTYAMTVGPRGGKVNLYAGKINDDGHFMAKAVDVGLASAREIHARAWERAMRK